MLNKQQSMRVIHAPHNFNKRYQETIPLNQTGIKGIVFCCVPSVALMLQVKVRSRVFAAKCSKPQVGAGNGMDEGSGMVKIRIVMFKIIYEPENG